MIHIKTIQEYKLGYDERSRQFVLSEADGTEVAYGQTQEEVEEKAKKLRKQEFKRIPIIRVDSDGHTTLGELTSFNRDDASIWVSLSKGLDRYRSGRLKINLRFSHNYFESSSANLVVAEALKGKGEDMERLRKELKELEAKMEKPINLTYFREP